MDKGRPGKIVADSSAIAAIVMEEQSWEGIAETLSNNMVITADFAWAECANVIWKTGEPQRIERLKKAMVLVDRFETASRYIEEALEIAVSKKTPVYDALFIALSKKFDAELITRDKKQVKIAREAGAKVLLL